MHKIQYFLLCTTALSGVTGASFALAADPTILEVSAPSPGEVRSIVGDEAFDSVVVGAATGERGTLTIGAGQTLTSGVDTQVGAVIGRDVGASGTVQIEGAGATWTEQSGWAHLGDYGTGELFVLDGAELSTRNFVIANQASGAGTVTVDGPGTLWTNQYNIEIGRAGTGVVVVSGGAQVHNNETLKIGFGDGAGGDLSTTMGKGSLSLTGADTRWINTGGATLTGDATLMVENGASFETVQGGLYTKEGGTIIVTGPGTTMKIGTLHDTLPVDFAAADGWFSTDSGTILISDGAQLLSDGSYIGGGGTVAANMTVTGAGTVWDNLVGLYVGGTGNGTTGTGNLTIADGARATGYTLAIGVDAGSTGKVLVTGEDSLFRANMRDGFSGKIRVGFNGTGKLVLQDGGTASTDAVLSIAENAGSVGTLVIGAEEGSPAAAAGVVESAQGISFGAGDGTLVFNHTDENYAFDHVLTGTGGLIRQLAGVTDLTADSTTFSGQLDVLGGTLKANADLSGVAAFVEAGGTLGGSGVLGSVNVAAGGVLAPGNSPGTLTVEDDVDFAAGSYFDVEIDGTGSDRVLVEDGDVDIAAGAILRLTPSLGTELGHEYTIIGLGGDSEGEVRWAGQGFTVDETRPLLDSFVDYSSEDVTVRFEEVTSPWSSLLETPNQGAAADAVQAMDESSLLRQSALFVDEDLIGDTFDMLSGDLHASIKGAQAVEGEYLRATVFDRLTTPRPQDPVEPVEPIGYAPAPASGIPFPGGEGAAQATPTTVWSEGYGVWSELAGDGNAAALTTRTGGVFIGADTLVNGWQVGLLGGFGRSSFAVDEHAASGTSSNYQLGGYAGTSFGAVTLRSGAGYTLSTVETTRNVTIPEPQELTAAYNAALAQVFTEVGYRLETETMTLEPFAGLALANLSTDGYAEAGGDAALAADASQTDIAFSTLGLRASSSVDLGGAPSLLTGMVGWRHAAGDTSSTATHGFDGSQAFTVTGLPVAEDALLLQLGLGVTLGTSSTLDLSYDGEFAVDNSRQALRGGLTTRF